MAVAPSSVSHWEAGKTLPEGRHLDRLCDLFGITFGQLFQADGQIAPTNKIVTVRPSIDEALKVINTFDGLLSIKIRSKKK
jgi:transcriptional regulator with XRE-family HTH domain